MASSITRDYSQISSITVSDVPSGQGATGIVLRYVIAGFATNVVGTAVPLARYGGINKTTAYSGAITMSAGSLTTGTAYYAAVGRMSQITSGVVGPDSPYGGDSFGSMQYGYYTGGTTIIFDANGGSGAPPSVTTYWAANSTMTSFRLNEIPSTIPTRSGYKFLGWNISRNATTAAFTAGQSYPTVPFSTTGSTKTLYAVWKADTPPLRVKVGGAWKTATAIKVKVDGVWKDAIGMKIKANGTWEDAT